MTLWEQTQNLPEGLFSQVRAFYTDKFPIDVRHVLARWLEDRVWTNHTDHEFINSFAETLAQECESSARMMTSKEMLILRSNLLEAANNFRTRYAHSSQNLFELVKHLLNQEWKCIQEFHPQAQEPVYQNGEITLKLRNLQTQTQETTQAIQTIDQEQEAFTLKYHECTKISASLQQLKSSQAPNKDLENRLQNDKNCMEALLQNKVGLIVNMRYKIVERLKDTIQQLSLVQARILDEEMLRWKRNQQLSGNGANFNSNLDNIQDWCERLAELIWLNRQQIKEMERVTLKVNLNLPVNPDLRDLDSQITQLLSSLVTSTFVIEKQPPQVMKTNTRFAATVRLLVGGQLNVNMNPPQVKVTIISESQANALLRNDNCAREGSGEILNNIGTMEYNQGTRHLSINFRNMQLKKIKRAEKKGTESVMDEKFSLLFTSKFTVGGGELVFQVWTLSLPVVVIVHGNQEPHAWATVTWDNAFAEPGRQPFVVPERVPWPQLAEALNMKFKAATSQALFDQNLTFLAEKAFRGTYVGDYTNALLTWTQFCKEPLPDRSFTFWEWFYSVMKLTKEHLKSFWVDQLIHGFIRKKQAEEMLSTCEAGTFLLRFSDSELGGITIAWVDETSEVFSLQPFSSKDFAIRSLADRISDLKNLVKLYPNRLKEDCFGPYCTPVEVQKPISNGYVKPLLMNHIPPVRQSMMQQAKCEDPSKRATAKMGFPNTPSMLTPQSPADTVVSNDPGRSPYAQDSFSQDSFSQDNCYNNSNNNNNNNNASVDNFQIPDLEDLGMDMHQYEVDEDDAFLQLCLPNVMGYNPNNPAN
ncbi:signal transducer and activator of transcription 5B [Nilaparvata lugens]|uniref:signal transducer and activator of transcription 5B n=1 Tax=Nilaparvata lugens TaxID=108931 RepID=UPI00193E55D5|nr:signal transducer and activator of transcription 5B [Nilaparvata lugens]XP_039282171.1 signal transducer and activator of transcription 5B [Nilaparvata lugens]